jgi:hypothetical protein
MLSPHGHHSHEQALHELAKDLWYRIRLKKSQRHIDESIGLHRYILSLRPPGHKERAPALRNLALSLWSRSELIGSLGDLDESIKLYTSTISLYLFDHKDRKEALRELADALRYCFQLENGNWILTTLNVTTWKRCPLESLQW